MGDDIIDGCGQFDDHVLEMENYGLRQRIASLESQLTAARRSVAEVRAWVEGEIAAFKAEFVPSPDYTLAEMRADTLREVLARLTEPSPAAPADDAKPAKHDWFREHPSNAQLCRHCMREWKTGEDFFSACPGEPADDAKPEAGRSSDGNR